MSILIKNATVVTNDKKKTIYALGAVFIDGKKIKDVGPSKEIEARYPKPGRVIDAAGKVVIPGLISLHTHAGWTCFRGMVEDRTLYDAAVGTYNPMNALMSHDERRRMGLYTYMELLRSGVTTVVEMEEDIEAVAPAVKTSGIRSAMGLMAVDVPAESLIDRTYKVDPALRKDQNERSIRFAKDWHGESDGRITTLIAPRGVANCSEEQLTELRKAADKLGRRIAIHLGWGKLENEVTGKKYNKKAFQYAHDVGMMGEDVITTHCYVADEDDFDLLVKTKTHIGHCPQVNAMRGQIAPIADLRSRGLNVGLGTDNYFSDFFEVMRSAATVARVKTANPMALVSEDVLDMATMGAARALGMENELGSLEKGKRADVTIVDAGMTGLGPLNNPLSNLIWHATMHHVHTVLVDGEVLLDAGKFTKLDEKKVQAETKDANHSAWARFVQKYDSTCATTKIAPLAYS